ncbi:MAG: terminase family protein [Sphaerobacter thermophilus]|uniref:terminase large subunit domain-containing protein n=1 Tax=Sphaerobacter thermophilus TaxID=2057 RepID=UPI00396ECFCA
MLAEDLAVALDRVLLARRAGIEADPWQAAVLRSNAPRMLLNCARQTGKSTTTAILAVHTLVYRPGSLVLVLSPSLRQSQELFRKCIEVYRALDRPVPAEAESALRLELVGGSRLVSLPGTERTTRGFGAVDLLIIDEAARVDDSLYQAVRPMLATSNGRLVALSTPWGKRGWWYEAWAGGGDWERIMASANICPRISPEFLAEERATLGEWLFRQEYLCEFVDNELQVFPSDLVQAALSDDVPPLFPEWVVDGLLDETVTALQEEQRRS